MISLWRYTPGRGQGELIPLPLDIPLKHLDDLTNLLPAGVYTTFRTYNKYSALDLQAHIRRLERSAELKAKLICLDEGELRQHLRRAIREHPAEENRVRIILAWQMEADPEIYLAVDELVTPSQEQYRKGVWTKTVRLSREDPEAKATDFILQTAELRAELTNGVNELLMVDPQGEILEGLSSNFFAVNGEIVYTRDEGVLQGITRDLVIQVVNKLGLKVRFTPVSLTDLSKMDEAFITSASRGVLPVVKVDDLIIGNGTPGKTTRLLMESYKNEVESLIQTI